MGSIQLHGLEGCQRCPRLVDCIKQLSPVKSRMKNEYHSAPVNGFGDLRARICLVGLAPGAHGANRTGRPFTGDGAGDFMYPLLYSAGFSSQATAVAEDDGLELYDLYITNAVKCLPPENRPNAMEYANCRAYLLREIEALNNLQVIIGLGHGAFASLLRLFQEQQIISKPSEYPLAHAATYKMSNDQYLVGCYHTSRYNVQTGRMTDTKFKELLLTVKQIIH